MEHTFTFKVDLPDDHQWKQIEDSPFNLVSDQGAFYSLRRERYLTSSQMTNGYWNIELAGIGQKLVHRLVAEAFCSKGNFDSKAHVHHKDHNRSNNRASNLEWVDPTEHRRKHNELNDAWKNNLEMGNIQKRVPIEQYSLDGKFVARYSSALKAQKATDIAQGNISKVVRGERNHAGGYSWKIEN